MVLYARDIVESDFISFRGETDALEAAKAMKDRSHGFVIVISEDGKPEGIVTEWDYLSKLVAEGRDPRQARLKDIMTPNLITVKGDDGIDYVASLMAEKRIRRVLVLDKGGVLGFITAHTLLARLKEYVDRVTSQIARLQAPPY